MPMEFESSRRFFLRAATSAALAGIVPARALRAQTRIGLIKLMVGTAPPDPACHYFYFALENGFYREQGLEVAIQPIAAETTAVRGLVAGECDVAWVGAISTLQAVAAGSRLKVLSCFTPRLDYFVVAQQSVASLKALGGRSVGISQVGAVSQLVPKMMIELASGDTARTQWVSVGGSAARVQALVAKRIDGAVLNSAFASRALKYDYLHVIGDAVTDLPHFIYTWEAVSEAAVAQKPAALQAFVIGTAKGVRWAVENPDQAAAISRKLMPDVPPEELAEAANTYAHKQWYAPTGELARADWDFSLAQMMKNGDVTTPLRYDDIVLLQFVAAETRTLGPFRQP